MNFLNFMTSGMSGTLFHNIVFNFGFQDNQQELKREALEPTSQSTTLLKSSSIEGEKTSQISQQLQKEEDHTLTPNQMS